MLLELYNIKSHEGSVSFIHLSYCSFLPYFPLFLFPRDSVFCRWAWRLASSVLHRSLQQNQYLRTICTALLSGGWGLMLQLHLKFHPHFKTCRGQIYMPVSHHCYLTRVSAVRTALTFTAGVQAGQVLQRNRRILLRLRQFMWTKTTEHAQKPQGILEGFLNYHILFYWDGASHANLTGINEYLGVKK